LLHHERALFLKFFSLYFGSVALLILASGYFYFLEQKKSLIEKEHFSIIEYTRQLKMNMNPSNPHISYTKVAVDIDDFHMENFTIKEDRFEKYMPFSWEGGFFLVTKDKIHYEMQVAELRFKILLVQLSLLVIFALVSYFLAKKAILPMRNAIKKLDDFSKDLIHDLNTPITSILLNIKLLEADEQIQKSKALSRIKTSADDISKLHTSLEYLLNEEGMILRQEPLFEIVEELVQVYKKLYPQLHFYIEYSYMKRSINRDAFKQLLSNIISNACKYNKEGGYIKIYKKEQRLCIEDSGVGIEHPQSVFERSYKEHKRGHGIGLDIVKRLCDAMEIEIQISSQLNSGTTISLRFV